MNDTFTYCPKCKSVANITIAYGKPDEETMELDRYGLIHMAGCVIDNPRINRHCKACGCDFISNEFNHVELNKPVGVTLNEMEAMLKELEGRLHEAHQDIEREYMRFGRAPHRTDMTSVIKAMRIHHEAWALFLANLQGRGDSIVVLNNAGETMARYSMGTASIYLVKNLMEIYMLLEDLARASQWLGRTSRGDKDNIYDLKDASIALENARKNIRRNWRSIRDAALGYLE